MKLLQLIRRNRPDELATAIPATVATDGPKQEGTVARIATIAVATHRDAETHQPVKHRPKQATALQALEAGNDPQPDSDRWCFPATGAMRGAEVDAFTARVQRFTGHGLSLETAEAMADTLQRRDRDGDVRRICLECSYLGEQGRCLAAATGRIPGASRRLEPVVNILQRCDAFGLRKGLT